MSAVFLNVAWALLPYRMSRLREELASLRLQHIQRFDGAGWLGISIALAFKALNSGLKSALKSAASVKRLDVWVTT
jgi:hypothetical protein